MELERISEVENRLIIDANNEYGDILVNTKAIVNILWHLKFDINENTWLFFIVLSQLRNAMTLSLLSVIRCHETQAYMMLRQALEAAVMAGYCMTNPKESEFMNQRPDGLLNINIHGKTKANKWLETNYPNYSKNIKEKKEKFINKYFAHPNMITSFRNTKIIGSSIAQSIFDMSKERIVKANIWIVGELSLSIIEMLMEINKHNCIGKLYEEKEIILLKRKHYELNDILKQQWEELKNKGK